MDVKPSPPSDQGASSTPEQLCEHEPLKEILSEIPSRVQHGLKTQYEKLELTCLDANKDYITLGTNVGVVFLYDREKCKLERLKSESPTDSVTCMRLHHGLDHLVAIGYRSGSLYIFQLPSQQIGHSKQLERFIVSDLHTVPISCLTWSVNGMKLYSGDRQGGVGSTEVDFEKKQCQSIMLLIEASTEIVQLDQGHRSLLVSTKHRTLICRMDEKNKLIQVGQKERKIQGNFGACFIPALCKPDEAQMYVSRPGFRIWLAGMEGNVSNTYIFKEMLNQNHRQIPQIPCEVISMERTLGQIQFGPLRLFKDRLLVTWNERWLYVLDCNKMTVVESLNSPGIIQGVAITEDEIFLLRKHTDRNLIRLAYKPLKTATTQVLKQLALEREKPEHREDKTSPVFATTTSKDTKLKEISPKHLKENILSTLQKISSPMKEKLFKADDKSEKKYSQGYEFEGSSDQSIKKSSASDVITDLPPVIQLASPDILSITLTTDFDGHSVESGDEIMTNTFSKSPTPKINNMAASLQNGTESEKGQPSPGNGSLISGEVTKENFPEESLNRITFDIPDEDDSIVFSAKTSKGKKKKKGKSKSSQSRESDDGKLMEPDTVSVNSVTSGTSVASDNSEHVSPAKQDNTASKPNELSEESMSHSVSEESVPITLPVENVEQECDNSLVSDESSKTKHRDFPVEDFEVDDVSSTIVRHSLTMSTSLVEEKEIVNEADVERVNETETKVTEMADQVKSVSSSVQISLPVSQQQSSQIVKPKDSPRKIEISLEKGRRTTDICLLSQTDQESTEHDAVDKGLNLDREIVRLNAFMKQHQDEVEATSSGVGQISTSMLSEPSHTDDKKQNLDKIYTGLFDDVDGSNDSYEESALDRQIHDLDISSMSADTERHTTVEGPSNQKTSGLYSIYQTPATSTDDFYSKYTGAGQISRALSPTSSNPLTSPDTNNSDDDEILNSSSSMVIKVRDQTSSEPPPKSVNIWTEFNTNANICSLSISDTHVWYTDKSNNIYYSPLSGPGVNFRKAIGSARQIAVSPEGHIVWCLKGNTALAGTKITTKRPEGMKWVEAVKDVNYIAVDETCAWYIKTSGEVKIQTGLSKERPCYTATSVSCSWTLKQIVCRSGVVWALTDDCQWVYRKGITRSCPQGQDWARAVSESENKLFSAVALGAGNLGWAMDVVGNIWFTCGVTMETPKGDNKWWQVTFSSEYLVRDMTTLDMLKSLTAKLDPQKLSQLLSTKKSGLICAGEGVWVCPEFKHILHVCRGSLEGHCWSESHPERLPASSCWKTVVASTASHHGGLVWAQQPTGDLFTFTADQQTCLGIATPRPGLVFVCISVTIHAVWGLTSEGMIYIRTGVGPSYPQGSDWTQLDLSQLSSSHLVYVTCGKMNVWAVDSDGCVFHRIGVKAPSDHSLNAAWLPVDNGGTVFTHIVAGTQEWMVWAIDNKRQVYVRTGITQEMPIGRKWAHVAGTAVTKLTISDSHIWALNPAGELLCRYGITEGNIAGDYWKKMPGYFAHVTASSSDELWAINREGQLIRRHTKYIVKKDPHEDLKKALSNNLSGAGNEDGDWELV